MSKNEANLAIDIQNLTFTYAGADTPVFQGLDWQVPAGAFALLVGNTGSGKSTLLSLLKPEVAPAGERGGTLCVLGRKLSGLAPGESARKIGFVFQSPDSQLVCESVWHEMAFGLENLGLNQETMRRRVAETSYFFGMEDWFRHDVDTLSGGRKQLLALASTLVMRPSLLLLDEPTAQLDPIAERNFLHALFRINRELGCSVVVATHRPQPMADYASCAFRLSEGCVEKIENFEFLQAREPLFDKVEKEACLHPAPSLSSTPFISLRRAWFRYARDSDWVLRNLDLDVQAGSIHALVGGNGCGKSTLLSLMAGALKLQRGSFFSATTSRALLPQDPRSLFAEETVDAELMEWARVVGYGQSQANDMLDCLGLSKAAALHPLDLSGGQQQLLALGKLLLTRPRLLLLDEPTKGLDLVSRRLIARLLCKEAAEGVTVVLATHDLDFASQLPHVVSMIFDGEVSCTSPRKEFFKDNVYYRP